MSDNRKILLINVPFQTSVITWFSLLGLSITVIYYLAIFFFFREMTGLAQEAGLPEGHVVFRFIQEQQNLMHKIFIASSAFALLVVLIGGLWLSHRVAGPLHRLIGHLRSHSLKSEVPPVKFRKGDYFKEIEEAFNEFIKK